MRFDDKDILTQEFFDDLFNYNYLVENQVWVMNIQGVPVWMTLVKDKYVLEFHVAAESEEQFFVTAERLENVFKYMDGTYLYTVLHNEVLKKVWFTIYTEDED